MAEPKPVKLPKSFGRFRLMVAAAMRKAGMRGPIVAEMAMTGYEGAGIPQEAFRAWEAAQEIIADSVNGETPQQILEMVAETPVHDLIINLVCDFERKPEAEESYDARQERAKKLADRVVAAFSVP